MSHQLDDKDRRDAAAAGITAEQQAALTSYHSLENWTKLHKPQLESMQLPVGLYLSLYSKVYNETFDLDSSFQLQPRDDGPGHSLVCTVEDGLKAGDQVWIVDHFLTFTVDAAEPLLQQPGVKERLEGLVELVVADTRNESNIEAETGTAGTEGAGAGAAGLDAPRFSNASSSSTSSVDYASEESISLVMQQAGGVSRESAISALTSSRGDLIVAINHCIDELEGGDAVAKELNQQLEKLMEGRDLDQKAKLQKEEIQKIAQADAVSSSFSSSAASDSGLSILWESLFSHQLVHQYFTMRPRPPGVTGPVRGDEVETNYFVLDETGSVIRSGHSSNCIVSPLVVVTLSGQAFSVVWLTKDVEYGEGLVKPIRPALQRPKQIGTGGNENNEEKKE